MDARASRNRTHRGQGLHDACRDRGNEEIMPPRPKGARLWLQPGRPKTEKRAAEQAVWIIRDGNRKISTGCGPDARREAEERLAVYILERYQPDKTRSRDPAQIRIADILSIYLEDKGPQ